MALEGFYWVVVNVDTEHLATKVLFDDQNEAQRVADCLATGSGDDYEVIKLR